MTSGYDPHPAPDSDPHPGVPALGPPQPTDDGSNPSPGVPGQRDAVPDSADTDHTVGLRPGPMPPRMEPARGEFAFPVAPPIPFAGPPVPPPGSVAGYGPPNQGVGYPSPSSSAGFPTSPARRRLAWPGVTALLLVLALAGAVGFEAYQIDQLTGRLGDADRRLAEAQRADGARLDSIEGRTQELENQAGQVFNPEAISSTVLPSVFRVRAGQLTGTAFAVGKPTANGGTNLFTNFHVVEEVWNGGGRQVFLERTDQRFPATITKIDKVNDVAQLSTDSTFTGLIAAPAMVKSGQQIVVVGAPLGLEDSVTTGVVSAFRDSDDGTGKVIQFDAPINPGNSGGPVINGAKQVVGIATAKARDAEGIGLAVPIKTACDGFKIC
jgi:putative serine protease PepD